MRPGLNLRLSSAILAFAFAGSAALAADKVVETGERASDKEDKIICKRFIETGSLIKGYRTCKTKREWEHERDNIRTAAPTSGSCNSGESGTCTGPIG